jgi:AcrR family transcriptional regulator
MGLDKAKPGGGRVRRGGQEGVADPLRRTVQAAAGRTLAGGGSAAVSISGVASTAGISDAAVRRVFATREALLRAATEEVGVRWIGSILAAIPEDVGDLREMVSLIVDSFYELAATDRNVYRLLLGQQPDDVLASAVSATFAGGLAGQLASRLSPALERCGVRCASTAAARLVASSTISLAIETLEQCAGEGSVPHERAREMTVGMIERMLATCGVATGSQQ